MWQQFFCYSVILQGPYSAQIILAGHIQSDLGLSMFFDALLKPAYSPARVNRALVMNGRIGTRQGCMGLSHIHNEYPYRRYEQQNQEFMTEFNYYRVQTIY